MKILVVDDFSTMRRIVKNLLQELGYSNIQEADDGNTALPLLKAAKFDFVVTDWNMPGMTGIDLLKAIRADPALKATPVLKIGHAACRERVGQYVSISVVAVSLKKKRKKNKVII